jgi:hypothetical protein
MHHSLPMLLIEYVVIGFVAPIFCNWVVWMHVP